MRRRSNFLVLATMIYLFYSIIIGILLFFIFLIMPTFFYFIYLITKRNKYKDIANDLFYFMVNEGALIIILYLANVPFWVGIVSYFLGGFEIK